jgi:hypothetical protein
MRKLPSSRVPRTTRAESHGIPSNRSVLNTWNHPPVEPPSCIQPRLGYMHKVDRLPAQRSPSSPQVDIQDRHLGFTLPANTHLEFQARRLRGQTEGISIEMLSALDQTRNEVIYSLKSHFIEVCDEPVIAAEKQDHHCSRERPISSQVESLASNESAGRGLKLVHLRSPNISKFVGTPPTTILLMIRIQIPRARLAIHYHMTLTRCKENYQYRPHPQPHEKESTRYQPQFSPLHIASRQCPLQYPLPRPRPRPRAAIAAACLRRASCICSNLA